MQLNTDKLNAIADALDNVSLLKGVRSYNGTDLAVEAKYYDSYMIAYVLSKMIREGDCFISVSGNRVNYLNLLIKDQRLHNEQTNKEKTV